MKRICSIILCVFLFASSASGAETYVFILKWLGNPYWQALKQGIEETSKERGIDAVILSPVNDQMKEEHLNLCQAGIARSPKIIVMGAATTAIGLECFRQAQSRSIKTADVDATVAVEEAKKGGVELAFTIGADNILIGKRAAEFVKATVQQEAPKVLILEGVVGSPPSTDRVRGFKEHIAQLIPKAAIVGSISAEWDRLRGLQITTDMLQRHPDLAVIFAANDVMALGAVEAVRAAGKTGKVAIVGVDGVPDARKAILEGKMTASLTQLPYLIGKRAVEKAIDSVTGKTVEPTERAPVLVLTEEVLKANSDPLLKYVR
jgi:D-allose transport system substrate-binding protein